MAELIGVISGAITFGSLVVQLATSINKLKDSWEQFHGAPEDLKWLIRDIEIFGLVLAEIEDDSAQESVASNLTNNKSALQSFRLCKEASEELDILVKDLGRDIDSSSRLLRSYASLKMTIQKNKAEKYRSRLKNAAGLLMLSQQCYTRALVQAQHELITKKVASGGIHQCNDCQVKTLSFRTASSHSIVATDIGSVERSRNPPDNWHSSFTCHFKGPAWMTTKALELTGQRAPGGWKFAFRTFNTISRDSKAVRFAVTGNIQGLQDLFALREASPLDRVGHNGRTLLHYVDGSNSEKVFEFLLNQGADPSIRGYDSNDVTPLEFLVWSGNQGRARPLFPSLRLLVSRSEEIVYNTPDETINGILSEFHGTAAEFKFLQQKCCPKYYQMPQYTRVAVAAQIASGVWDAQHMPELLRTALGKDPLSIDNLQIECFSKRWRKSVALVHSIAGKIGRSLAGLHCRWNLKWTQIQQTSRKGKFFGLCAPMDEHRQEQMLLYKSWNTMFCELLSAGIDIHKIVGQSTPFSSFLSSYLQWCCIEGSMKLSDVALKIWLGDLQTYGLDLEDFGQIEEHLFNSGYVDKDFQSGWRYGAPRLINFTYGSSPNDWHLWISETSDCFVGEFWCLIERQGEVMCERGNHKVWAKA